MFQLIIRLGSRSRSGRRSVLRILAIETSGAAGGVAALDDGNVLAELTLDTATRSAQSLAPGLAASCARSVGSHARWTYWR